MTQRRSAAHPGLGTDLVYDKLVEEIVDKLQAGEAVDLEDYRVRYPEHVGKLEQLIPAIELMAEVGLSINPRSGVSPSARADSAAPKTLGDFRIGREIGHGGMATVYEAEQVSLRRRVALKVLLHAAALDSRQRERFQLEARAAALLKHTHIVPVYAVGSERGVQYYAMQLIEGASLAVVIKNLRERRTVQVEYASDEPATQQCAFNEPTLAEIAHQLASGSLERQSRDSTYTHAAPSGVSGDGVGSGFSAASCSPAVSSVGVRATGPPEKLGDPGIPSNGLARLRSFGPRFSWSLRRSGRGRAATYASGFYRSAAVLALHAAEALDHAHQLGVIHRDVKPANLLLDRHGKIWVADFGLALTQEAIDLTRTGDLVGTLRYMSPEQAMGKPVVVDHRTDIYSLGATLYELLTLTPAVPGQDRQEVLNHIARAEPLAPRRIESSIPIDLETIVFKAIAKGRDDRYASAHEFAVDLRRFLNDEPILARRQKRLERAARWARRHQAAVAGAFAFLILVAVGLGISTAMILREQQRTATAARNSEREVLFQQILQLRSTAHTSGWSDEIRSLIKRASRLGPDRDRRLQSDAAASLNGLDAQIVKRIPLRATAARFDPSGKVLYLSGADGRSWAWDSGASSVREIGTHGAGTFAFSHDSAAVHLRFPTEKEPHQIELRDINLSSASRTLISPLGSGSRFDATAVTPDAAFVAATILTNEDSGSVVVWNADTGEIVRQVKVDRPTAVSLAPDGSLVAVGTKDGQLIVWPLPSGEPLARLSAGRVAVTCVAFGQDRLVRAPRTWQVAVCDVATGISVFDLGSGSIRSRCRGSDYETYALAFSPDGMLLASSGRGKPCLWDVQTGRLILQLADIAMAKAIDFSRDGKRIAVCGERSRDGGPEVFVYKFENGFGFQTLWGLDAQIDRAIISNDNRLVAALAQDFRVGIWDRAANQLLHVLEVPVGVYSDNAGLAFSSDGQRFAYAAGKQVRTWDVGTGKELESWPLPDGFQDNLAFADGDRLISARVETDDPRVPPYGNDASKYPRVLRIRSLDSDAPAILAEIRDFNVRVLYSELTRDGRSLLAEGVCGSQQAPVRLLKAFDVARRRELWKVQVVDRDLSAALFTLDPTGRIVGRGDSEGVRIMRIMDFHSRLSLESYGTRDVRGSLYLLGPEARLRLCPGDSKSQVCLRGPGQELYLSASDIPFSGHGQFSVDGRFAVWGNPGSTVTVLDPLEVNKHLTGLGLGW